MRKLVPFSIENHRGNEETDLSRTGAGFTSVLDQSGSKVTIKPDLSRMLIVVPSVLIERVNRGGQSYHGRLGCSSVMSAEVGVGSAPSTFSGGSSGGLNRIFPFLWR